MPLPSGTVTFLFTDIEGSTQLWERYPEAMSVALARHDLLLRQTIESQGGEVFKTIGDAFCAVFATAPQGLAATIAAQEAIAAEAWPTPVVIKVRMALHTGAAEYRNEDYFGQTLNRVARLLAIGHGGQVLLSDVTQELVRDRLPPLVGLRDQGSHLLKDLMRPEHIFQLVHPHLPREFPPLRSLNNPNLPNNLPQQVTSFIGREREMAEITALLERTRLLTLVGTGGAGKTRLSLQFAADMLDGCGDGVWFVELAPIADANQVAREVAATLGVKEEPGKPVEQTITEFLRPKHLLLILDNCEHVLASVARLADGLLRTCPRLSILATSREGLGIAGETLYRVPSLSLPQNGQPMTPQVLTGYEAARLFIERATAVQPTFAVTTGNAPALAQLCVRLDGIPLALELAAARVRVLSVEEVNNRLDDRFRLLTGGSRAALPRQQTLRALIDWSYDLLNETERILLRRLSVFAGGWTLDAAEQVCTLTVLARPDGESGLETWEVLDLISSLVDKSLVVAEPNEEQTRYRMLETVRQYSNALLREQGEADEVRWAHRDYYRALAEQAEQGLRGPEQRIWLNLLETEHDNLRWALSCCRETPYEHEEGLRMGAALWRFWHTRGYYSEGREHLAELIQQAEGTTPTRAYTESLRGAGVLHIAQSEYDAGRALLQQARTIYENLGDRQGVANVLNNLGTVAWGQGDYIAARDLYGQSLTLMRELDNQPGIAVALNNLGTTAWEQGDYTAARAYLQEGLEQMRLQGNRQGVAITLNNLGIGAMMQSDYTAAQSLFEESLALNRELSDRQGAAVALNNLGLLAIEKSDFSTARTQLEESLALYRDLGDWRRIPNVLVGFAHLAACKGESERAILLYGTADALLASRHASMESLERTLWDRDIETLKERLGAVAYDKALASGKGKMLEEALELTRA